MSDGTTAPPVVTSDPLDALAKRNLRERIHLMDLADALCTILEARDATHRKLYSRQLVADRLEMSLSHVTNLTRAKEKIADDVWREARTHGEVPANSLFKWASLDHDGQRAAFCDWKLRTESAASPRRKRRRQLPAIAHREEAGVSTPIVPAAVPRLTTAAPRWAQEIEEGARDVFMQIDSHGVATEAEATSILGSPRAFRRFSLNFEAHVARCPFRVRVETSEAGKRYVREEDR